ncbi:MAG: SDR family oxidoreductase [Acidobacteriota bacterium]|nr:SDR family oxidoreductase [Acidobacteriota bacterium]
MQVKGKVVVVTGAANGIGAALCRRFHKEGAEAVVAADIDGDGARRVAAEIGGLGLKVDVTEEQQIIDMVAQTRECHGRIDLFCSNAGIFYLDKDHAASVPNEQWQKIWEVNLMAHVYATRAILPDMLARGSGYILITASAAGLLSQIGSAPYSVTKHAAVGFAESIAIAHGDQGIRVSALCPQAVRTGMTESLGGPGVAGVDGMMEADILTDSVIEALAEERFLILPHPEVLSYMQRKTGDYDRWLGGMRKLRRQFLKD